MEYRGCVPIGVWYAAPEWARSVLFLCNDKGFGGNLGRDSDLVDDNDDHDGDGDDDDDDVVLDDLYFDRRTFGVYPVCANYTEICVATDDDSFRNLCPREMVLAVVVVVDPKMDGFVGLEYSAALGCKV